MSFEQAVAKIPSGLFIVCTKSSKNDDAVLDGYLASWIQQVSFSPMLITLAVKQGRPSFDSIMEGEPFTVNIVGEHDKSFLKHFWKGYDPNNNVFKEVPHSISQSGEIILTGALSHFTAKKVSSSKPGDHHLVVAEVISGELLVQETKPNVHIRKSALDY